MKELKKWDIVKIYCNINREIETIEVVENHTSENILEVRYKFRLLFWTLNTNIRPLEYNAFKLINT